MKRCPKCGNQNTDEMRFCLQCGNTLPDTPIVVNIGGTSPNQSDMKTGNYNQSVNTQVKSGDQYAPPDYITPSNRSGRGSNTKIFLAVGGVLALLLLLFIGAAAIVVYNMVNKDETVYVKPSPTPEPTRSTDKKSPTPEESATPKTSPTDTSRTPTLKTEEDNPDVTTKFDGVQVDYNITEKGRLGMRMKVNFTVTGMKGQDSYLAIHYQTRDGDPLSADKGEYRDVNGNLASFRTLKPDYDDTEYKDLELFLPYDEIKLGSGRHNLRMDIDLLDGKGVTVEHLGYNDFWYEVK